GRAPPARAGGPGGPLGEPASEGARVVAARARAGPRDGERQLERGHAAPRAEEVAGLEALQLRGGWGVVARHEVDRPLGQTGPQALAVLPLTNRRGALPGGGAVRDVVRGEGEVVRAGLDRQREAGAPRVSQPAQRIGSREVHDVNTASGLAGQPEDRV